MSRTKVHPADHRGPDGRAWITGADPWCGHTCCVQYVAEMTSVSPDPRHTDAGGEPDSSRIKAVIFDFGNVLCSFDIEIFIMTLAEHTGKPPETIRASIRASGTHIMEYESGLISSEEFFQRICRSTGITISEDLFRRAFCSIFSPITNTTELVRMLKPRYKVALLSNTNEWHFQFAIRPINVFPLFDSVTLSFQVKALKPAEEIYRDALRKLGLPPQRCVYIDDLEKNVDAASHLGMQGIHYTSHEDLLASLQEHGIHVS